MMLRLAVFLLSTLFPLRVDAAEIYWADPITEPFVRAFDEAAFGDATPAGSEFSLATSPHLRIDGPIVPGDNEKLGALLKAKLPDWSVDMHNNVVVSLNSEGGDFYEGLAMSDTVAGFAVMTFVGPNNVCLSSCAIIFLGGQNVMTRDNPPWPARYLHDTAKVGFHAPFSSIPVLIPVPEGTALDATLTGQLAASFYGQAQAAISEITQRMGQWNLSPGFVFMMLTKQTFENDTRPLEQQFYLIDNYITLIDTASALVTSELSYPNEITINAAEGACHFLTYANTRRTFEVFGLSKGLNYWLYKGAIPIAERPFLDRDATGNPILGTVDTVNQQYPKLVAEQLGANTITRLVPGNDPDAYFFDSRLPGLGAYQCSVFPFSDGRWYAKTFNQNVHYSDKYGVMRGTEWTPLDLLDHEKPYAVSEFIALGAVGSWLGTTVNDTWGEAEFSEDIRTIKTASFDCGGTLDPAAEIICAYPELAAWDGRMVALFRQARDRFGDTILGEQRDWVAVRNRLCRPEKIDLTRPRARNDLAYCLMAMTQGRAEGLRRNLAE